MCIYKVYAFVNNNRYFFTSQLLLFEVKSVINRGSTNNTVPSDGLPRYVHLQVQSLSWEVHQDQWTFLCDTQSHSLTFGVLQHCNSQVSSSIMLPDDHWHTEGGGGGWRGSNPPPPRNSEGRPKSCQTQPDCENC